MTDESLDPSRKNVPGIKREYLKIPEVVDDFENWICLQMQIPDDDDYIRLFYDLFDTYLSQWFVYQRSGNMAGARVAKVWRTARETIELGQCTGGVTLPACNPTPIGSILMWANTAAPPEGWLRCWGQGVLVADYPQLFDEIGYSFGGSGTIFQLPDFRGRSPIGYDGSGFPTQWLVGNHYGSLTSTLTAANLPPHTHDIDRRDNSAFGSGARVATASGAGTTSTQQTGSNPSQHLSTPVDILHPVVGIVFIIRASDNDCEEPVIEGPPGPPGPAGPPGPPGDCTTCPDDPPPGDDDNETPPPDGEPGTALRCKVAQGVVDSILDNYFIPLLTFYKEQFEELENTPEEVAEALKLMLQNQPGLILWPPAIVALIGIMSSAYFGAYITGMMAAYVAGGYQAIIDGLNDTDNREALYCMLFVELPDNGNIDANVWSRFITAVQDEPGTPFQELALYLTNQVPLYIARIEAFVTPGGAFDCAECGDLCPAQQNVWLDIGETPSTWTAIPAGAIDVSGWGGEEIHVSPAGDIITFETTTRSDNTRWQATGAASPGGGALRYMGVIYTPPEPCTINQARFQSSSNSGGGSKMNAIAVKLEDDSMFVLKNQLFTPAPVTDQPSTEWNGTNTTVKEIWYITGHYRGGGPVTIQIRSNELNVP